MTFEIILTTPDKVAAVDSRRQVTYGEFTHPSDAHIRAGRRPDLTPTCLKERPR